MSRTLQNQRNGREVWRKEMESGITGHPGCHIPLYGPRQMTLLLGASVSLSRKHCVDHGYWEMVHHRGFRPSCLCDSGDDSHSSCVT